MRPEPVICALSSSLCALSSSKGDSGVGFDKLSPQLRVMGGLVLLVSDRLELEGAVRDIEMSAEAFTEPIQYLT